MHFAVSAKFSTVDASIPGFPSMVQYFVKGKESVFLLFFGGVVFVLFFCFYKFIIKLPLLSQIIFCSSLQLHFFVSGDCSHVRYLFYCLFFSTVKQYFVYPGTIILSDVKSVILSSSELPNNLKGLLSFPKSV